MKGAGTTGGIQDQWFLTENDLYEILCISRKPIAKKLRIKVREILKEIRLTGKYESQKFIEMNAKSSLLIEQSKNKSINYIGIVKETEDYTLAKYGKTDFIYDTLNRHRKTYGEHFYFAHTLECDKNNQLKNLIQNHNDLKSRHVKEYEGTKRLELLRLDNNFTVNNLIELMKTLKESMETKYSIELELSKELTKQKELDNVRFQEETKQQEINMKLQIELKKIELELRRLELQVHITKQVVMVELKQDVIIEYFNSYTVFSANNLDTIKMTELYRKFVEWIKVQHPNN